MFADTRYATKIFRTMFVLFYCSPITQKRAKSFYIYLHCNLCRVSCSGKRTFSLDQGWASFSHEEPDLKKTVDAAGRTLIGKLGEDLFSLFFGRSRPTYECDLQSKRFSPRFLFQFCTVDAYFLENH